MKRFLFIIFIFCITFSFAQNKKAKDSINNTDSLLINKLEWINRIDSITQKMFTDTTNDIVYGPVSKDSLNLKLNDSLIKNRLSSIYSPLDISFNDPVKKSIKFYVKRAYKQVPRLLGLSEYYFPLFEEILDQYGVPYELKYLPVIESALNPEAVSRMGASGLWQFMYRTGKHMDMDINSYVDERFDPVKSTHAACKYLKDLHEIYNDWVLAIAAYNCGPGTLNRAIRRSGGKKNFWSVYNYLPYETRNYVPSFIAVQYLFKYYDEHGYKAKKFNIPHHVDTVMIHHDLHFKQISEQLDIDIKTLRFLNPAYKRDLIPAKKTSRHIILPEKIIADFINIEDSIHIYKDSVYLNPQKISYKPKNYRKNYRAPASKPKGTKKLTYTIKSGDAIGLIASWYDVSVRKLKAWNGMYSNRIRAGENLTVYVPEDKYNYYKPVNNMSKAEKQKREGITPKKKKSSDVNKLFSVYEYYTVKKGDNPWTISRKFEGVSATEIMQLNDISNPSSLKVGQKIKIRKKS